MLDPMDILTLMVGVPLLGFLTYLALTRPIIFPFSLYVMIVPFDNLFAASTTLTRLVALITGAVLLFQMIVTKRMLLPPKSWLPWGLYTLWATVSALWTIDPQWTSIILQQEIQLFLFFSILSIYPVKPSEVRFIGATVVLSGVALSGFGFQNYFSGVHAQGAETRLILALNGNELDPNLIAASLLLPIALAVGALISSSMWWLRIAALISTATMLAALFLTGSRGGLIGLSVMLLYIAWRTRYRLQVLGLMAVGGVWSLFLPTVWARFSDKGNGNGSGRTDMWRVAGYVFKHHPFLGVGLGGFREAYNENFRNVYQAIFQGWNRPVHNAYISAAVELGVLGLVLLVYAWYKSWTDAKGNVTLEAAVIGIAITSYFLDVMNFKYIWLVFTMAAIARNAAEPMFLMGMRPAPGKAMLVVLQRSDKLRQRENSHVARRVEWRQRLALRSGSTKDPFIR